MVSSTNETCTAIVLHPTLANQDNDQSVSNSNHNSNNRNRYRGLSNQGATCYLNSLLQSLYMTPEFRSALYSWTYDEDKDGPESECIPFQLQSLFGQMQLSKQGALTTQSLTKSFGWGNTEAFQQQDVQELCRVLFDRLEEAFKGTDNENLVNELYQGQMVDYLETIGYNYESRKPTEFLDISLQVKAFGSDKAFSSVDESLRSFLAPEKLEGDNQYFCEDANAKMDAIKGFRLEKLPYVLTLQLKRFDLDYTTFSRIKLNDQVRFPRVLDMNPFLGAQKHQNDKGDNTTPHEMGVEGTKFEKYMLEERERLKTSNGKDDEKAEEAEEEMPDLVDVCGNKAPSQLEEERLLKLALKEATYPEDHDPDPAELVKTEGEWVYELYAVLIHSGSALGGHYYAYIKNMAEQKWFNFNDSVVSEVDSFSTVRNAWGGASSTSSYGANAYMLMYRKFDPTRNQLEPSDQAIPQYIRDKIHEVEEAALQKQEIQKMRARQLEVKVVLGGPVLGQKEVQVSHDKEDDLKSLKIAAALAFGFHVKGQAKPVQDNGFNESPDLDEEIPPLEPRDDETTMGAEAKEEMKVVEAKELKTDLTSEFVDSINLLHPNGIDECLFRLREYNFTHKILVRSYDDESRSLAEAKFVSYKKIGLEVQPPGGFEHVIPDSNFVRLTWFDPTLPSLCPGDGEAPPPPGTFKDPVAVFYGSDWTVGDFRKKVADLMGIKVSKCRIMKMSAYSSVPTTFYDIDEVNLKSLYWYDGFQIWGEEMELEELTDDDDDDDDKENAMKINEIIYIDDDEKEETKLTEEEKKEQEVLTSFTQNKKKKNIKYIWPKLCMGQTVFDNESFKANLMVTLIDDDEPSLNIDVDTRWTIGILRKYLGKQLNVEPYAFRMKLGGGKECKDDKKQLRQEGFYKNMRLMLTSGAPPKACEFYIKCYLFYPQGLKPGVRTLPIEMTPPPPPPRQMEQGREMRAAEDQEVELVEQSVDATAIEESVEVLEEFEDMMVQPPSQAEDFDMYPMEVLVSEDTPISELRDNIKNQVVLRGLLEDKDDVNRIRIRDKQSYRGGKIARNGTTFKDAFVSLFDGKEIAATILNEPEDLSPYQIVNELNETTSDSSSMLTTTTFDTNVIVWIVRWFRDSYTIGEKFELKLTYSELLSDVNDRICHLVGIENPNNARYFRVVAYTTLKLSELEKRPYVSCLGQSGWQNFSDKPPSTTLKQALLNLLELSSDLLIVQDISEPIKKFATISSLSSSSSSSAGDSSTIGCHHLTSAGTSSKPAYVKPKETGIRIKTRQDRALEKEGPSSDAISGAQADADVWNDEDPPPDLVAIGEEPFTDSCMNELD